MNNKRYSFWLGFGGFIAALSVVITAIVVEPYIDDPFGNPFNSIFSNSQQSSYSSSRAQKTQVASTSEQAALALVEQSTQPASAEASSQSASGQSLTKVFETDPERGLLYTSGAGVKVYDCSVNVNTDLTDFAFTAVNLVSIDKGVTPPRRDLCEYSIRELFGSKMYVVEFPVNEASRDLCRSGGACDLRTAEFYYSRRGEMQISVTIVKNGGSTQIYGACIGLDLTLYSVDKNCRAI